MAGLCSVQGKIQCLFEVSVSPNAPSSKRPDQSYRIVATDRLRRKASEVLVGAAGSGPDTGHVGTAGRPTEKLDGTCVFVDKFDGKPWLWARHDWKPTRAADKRFRRFQSEHPESLVGDGQPAVGEAGFRWDVETDFKDVPKCWVPATKCAGTSAPDSSGHIPGWVPVDPLSKQHCWHLSAVDLNAGVGLVLEWRSGHLEISLQPLAELLGSTMELIGTHVNANPYRLGSKSKPLHLLVRHGIIPVENLSCRNFDDFRVWFQGPDGGVEGIVWHFEDGDMYKLHRNHMNLTWPVDGLKLLSHTVTVNIKLSSETANYSSQLLSHMVKLSGQTFGSLSGLKLE